MELFEFLNEYKDSVVPMHMPGHKRNTTDGAYLKRLAADIDVTEVEGLDDLHNAEGILSDEMARTAALWGSRRALWLVNGSTCGILACIYAAVRAGQTVICARNCHRSAYNGLSLVKAEPVFVMPEADELTGIAGPISASSIESALDENPEAKLVILTSPTYEGIVSDIAEICRLSHQRGVPVLVDEAHGSHLGFGHGFPDGAVHAGADMVVHSLHKTLPSLTQTAVLHLNGKLIDERHVKNALAIFETSSPSYLLMSSISGCVNLLYERGEELYTAWQDNLTMIFDRCRELRVLAVWGGKWPCDPSKIIISTQRASMTGPELATRLLEEHHIQTEMAMGNYCVAMTGMGDTQDNIKVFSSSLLDIDRHARRAPLRLFPKPILPEQAIAPSMAEGLCSEPIPLQTSVGRISAESVWAYPPGIPLVLPGELITSELLSVLLSYINSGIRLRSTNDSLPKMIGVIVV